MEEGYMWTMAMVFLLTGVIVAYKLWRHKMEGKDIDLDDVLDTVKDVHDKHGAEIKEMSEDFAEKDFGGAKDHLLEQKDEIMDEVDEILDEVSKKGDGDG